jgi:hypothetical protein
MDRDRDQVRTQVVSLASIMGSESFVLGVEDRRSGTRPQFDRKTVPNEQWNYERGRLWASIAPANMPLKIGKRINPHAAELFRAAVKRRYIR